MKAYNKLINLILRDGLTCEAVIINSPHNLRYFTGFTGEDAIALISADKRILITDFRYFEQAKKEAPDFKVENLNGKKLYEYLEKSCEDYARIGFEDLYTNVTEFDALITYLRLERVFEASYSIERLRTVKEDWELERIAKAEEIGSLAFSHILNFIKDGVTENEIAAELEYFMRKNGAEGLSFDTIAISGKKTSFPHGRPSNNKVKLGDFITMDFGCKYQGYCSDMTRTVVLGKANEKQKEIYNIVKQAQQVGLDILRSGVKCSDVDKRVREVIEKAGYGDNFGHALGHGVGLQIHETPTVSSKCDVMLEENMVISCEPGIYIPDFGGVRIEDLACIKNDGIWNLTSAKKELIEL